MSAETYSATWSVGDEVELEVARAALGGRLFGYAPDGRVVWIKPGSALGLGDVVRARVTKATRRSAEVEPLELMKRGAERVDPFCPHVDRCGGCPWQALSTEQQLETLSRDIDHQLSRAVGHEIPWGAPWSDEGQAHVDRAWRCTARLRSNGHGAIGFFGVDGLMSLDACPVFHPALNTLLEAVNDRLSEALSGGESELKLSVSEASSSATLAVSVLGVWSEAQLSTLRDALSALVDESEVCHGAALMAHTPHLLKATHTHERRLGRQGRERSRDQGGRRGRRGQRDQRDQGGRRDHRDQRGARRGRRSTRDQDAAIPTGLEPLFEVWGDPHNQLSTPHPAHAFMQAHQRGNRALIEEVVRGVAGSRHVLELYAGSGNLTIPLARADEARRVLALEFDERAVDSLNRAAELISSGSDGEPRVRAEVGSISALPSGDFDHVVLDPPRAGAAPIIDALSALDVDAITYISCHPAALARDLTSLAARGWRVSAARVFHLFPHSGHAEVYCRLERGRP